MTDTQVALLHSQLPRLRAERELELRQANSQLSPRRLHALVWLTTGDEDLASASEAKYILSLLRAGREVGETSDE